MLAAMSYCSVQAALHCPQQAASHLTVRMHLPFVLLDVRAKHEPAALDM